jgi:hypothetical protein
MTSSGVWSSSKIILVPTSQSTQFATSEQILSSSSALVSSSSQYHPSATQSASGGARSEVTSVYITSIAVSFPTSRVQSIADALSYATSVYITSTVASFRTPIIQSTPDAHSSATLFYTTSTIVSTSTPSNREQSPAPEVTSTGIQSLVDSSPDIETLAPNPTPTYTQFSLPSTVSFSASEQLIYTSRVSLAVLSASSSTHTLSFLIAPTAVSSALQRSVVASEGIQVPIATASSSSFSARPPTLASSQIPIITSLAITAGSTVAPPLDSASLSAIGSVLPSTVSSIVSSRPETPSSLGLTATWIPSSSKSTSNPALPQISLVTGNISSSPTQFSNLGISSTFQSDTGFTSVSMIGLPYSTPLPSSPTVSPYPSVPSSGSFALSSNVVKASSFKTSGSEPWPSATTISTPGALGSSRSAVFPMASVITNMSGVVSSRSHYTNEPSEKATATSGLPVVWFSQQESSTSSVTVTLALIPVQATSISSQSSPQSTSGYGGRNTTSRESPIPSSIHQSGVALPTGSVTVSIDSELSHPSLAPDWRNSTVPNLVINTTASAAAALFTISASPSMTITSSTLLSLPSSMTGANPTKTVLIASHSTISAATSVTSEPPLTPPLTVSQKAGVGIAGATGLLIAVVAAFYIVRRYRAKHARRSSTGSMYPKVAYLYDPHNDQSRRDGDVEEVLMSGGAAGMPPYGSGAQRPPNSVEYTKRHSTSTMPMRYSDPGNPFRDLEGRSKCSDESTCGSSRKSVDAETAFSAAINGYIGTSQRSSASLDTSVPEREESINWPSPTLDSGIGGSARSPSRQSILSEIASMACSPTARYNTEASRHQPSSPYGLYPKLSLPGVRETAYTDSCRDPFEHDLLLEVDTRTETSNFVTIYAPANKSYPPSQAAAPTTVQSNNPWASSMLCSEAKPSAPSFDDIPLGVTPHSPDATIVASERASLVYDDNLTNTYITPLRKQIDPTMSPISPLSGALHRGWDDIKRYSAEKVVPSVPTLSPPLGYSNKQRSLPQLRRKEPIRTSFEEVSLSSTRLPLPLRIPLAHNRTSSAETPKAEVHTAHEALLRGRRHEQIRSQDSTFPHSVHSFASLLQKKKSRDMEFACAGV